MLENDQLKDEFNPDGSFRRVPLIEEARIEAALTPHRRGQLFGLLADEIERLTAERDDLRKQWQAEQHVVEVLRRDALRYRWLRDVGNSTWTPLRARYTPNARSEHNAARAEIVDAAIDAAMKAGEA